MKILLLQHLGSLKGPLVAVTAGLLFALAPLFAGAQVFDAGGELSGFGGAIIGFINNILVPLVFAIAFLVFIWGVFKYFILSGDNEDSRESAKQLMLYAVIGFVLMVSIWGITNLLASGLGFDTETPIEPPSSPEN